MNNQKIHQSQTLSQLWGLADSLGELRELVDSDVSDELKEAQEHAIKAANLYAECPVDSNLTG